MDLLYSKSISNPKALKGKIKLYDYQ